MRIPVCASLALLASCVIPPTPEKHEPDIRKPDQDVQFYGLRLRLVRSDRAGQELNAALQKLKATNTWLVTEVEWTNETDGPWDETFTPVTTLFVNGAQYARDEIASAFLSAERNGVSHGPVNPGSKRTAVAVFDAPPGRTHLRVIVPQRANYNAFGNTVRGPYFFFDLGEVTTSSVH